MSRVPALKSRQLQWQFGARVYVMGILNVTPDSFSDGGRFSTLDSAMKQAHLMIEAGVDLIDVGGESTRPGAPEVDEAEELRRVMPVLHELHRAFPHVPVSIDTMKPGVAQAALDSGVSMVNDVTGLQNPVMRAVVAKEKVAACVMHMQGTPRTMQQQPRYADVVVDVTAELSAAIEAAVASGVAREQLLVDPGICFGKTPEHNWQLLQNLNALEPIGRPVVLGVSRKSFLGRLLGERSPEERVTAGTTLAALLAERGVIDVIRTHDVQAMKDALAVAAALKR